MTTFAIACTAADRRKDLEKRKELLISHIDTLRKALETSGDLPSPSGDDALADLHTIITQREGELLDVNTQILFIDQPPDDRVLALYYRVKTLEAEARANDTSVAALSRRVAAIDARTRGSDQCAIHD